jgi:hypothetical protein
MGFFASGYAKIRSRMPNQSKDAEIRLMAALRTHLRTMGITESVKRGWYPFKGQYAPFYSPVTDIAVGPYATEEGLILRYDELEASVHELINEVRTCYRENWNRYRELYPTIVAYPPNEFTGNENARCFIAVEVESKSTTGKHKLGSIVNAAALGRIGIVVGLDDDIVRALIRILGYLKFLASVRKPTFNANNTFIVTKSQLVGILNGRSYQVRDPRGH